MAATEILPSPRIITECMDLAPPEVRLRAPTRLTGALARSTSDAHSRYEDAQDLERRDSHLSRVAG